MQRCKVGVLGALLLLASGCALEAGEPGSPSSSSDQYADESTATADVTQVDDGKISAHSDQMRSGEAVLPGGPDLGGDQATATDDSGKPQPDPWRLESGTDPSKPQPDPWQPGTKVTGGSTGK